MKTGRTLLFALACGLAHSHMHAQSPKQIMVLGTFHFASDQDAIKNNLLDILSPQRQAEVEAVVAKLAEFAPQRIMVEWEAGVDQPFVDSAFAEYAGGRFALRANEVYQLGFRLAKQLGTGAPRCIDAPGAFLFDTLVYAAELGGQTAWFEAHMDSLMTMAIAEDTLRQALPIMETLLSMNEPAGATLSQAVNGVYVAARMGPIGDYSAAEFLGQWYQRNIRMYANICRSTQPADERILVIVGNGHRPILEQLLANDPAWEVVPAAPYLR